MKKISVRLKTVLVFFSCALVFSLSVFIFTDNPSTVQNTEVKDRRVPYEGRVPENTGLLFTFPSGSAVMFFLDFSSKQIITAVIDEYYDDAEKSLGYEINHTISADFGLTEGFIDRIGGVDLNVDDQELRYTGVQVADILSKTNTGDIRRQIVSAVLEKISRVGISSDDFVYIIENSSSSLTLPDCIYWIEHIPDMCMRYILVN